MLGDASRDSSPRTECDYRWPLWVQPQNVTLQGVWAKGNSVLQNIGNGEFIDEYAHISQSHYESLSRHHVQSGDLVIAALGETLPRSCVIPPWIGPALVKADCPRFRPHGEIVKPEYVNHALNAPLTRRRTSTIIHGVGRPRLNLSEVRGIWIPIAPKSEQRRIVAKIDELFSDLDAGVAALERAKANLKRYRAAVLKAAVEGRLTEQWRADNPNVEPASKLLERILQERRKKWEEEQLRKYEEKGKQPPKNWKDKYKEPEPVDTTNLLALPEAWCWVNIEQLLTEKSCNGISVKGTDEPPGVPALRLNAMNDNGFDYTKRRYIPISAKLASSLAIRCHDFFVSRGNGSLHLVGRGTLANDPGEQIVFPDTMIRLRLWADGMLQEYIALIWASRLVRRQIEKRARTTAGIYKISQRDIDAFAIPLPPLNELAEIVHRVEDCISVVETVETQNATSLKRASRLRQSILKRAFEGKLVPQDSNDEPANKLLRRIKAAREASNANGKPTKHKPRRKGRERASS